MSNVINSRRKSSVTALSVAILLLLLLLLAYGTSLAGAVPVENSTVDEAAPRALLVGFRAGTRVEGQSPDWSAVTQRDYVQNASSIFESRNLYHDAELNVTIALDQIYRLELAPGSSLEAVMAELQKRPDVAFVEPDYVAHQIAIPNDPLFAQQWGLAKINAPAAWNVQTGGAVVAIIDAGIDVDHPDLVGRLWTNAGETAGDGVDNDSNTYVDDIHGWNFFGNNADLSDSTGHGTQVAGLVAATGNNGTGIAGVCWDCELMVLKVIQPGGIANYSDIAKAITYAVNKGAKVINLSLGGYNDSVTLRTAVAEAEERGVVVIGGAGNDDDDRPFYPAAYETVLAVAGTDAGDVRVNSSNYGDWVDLSAPGSEVLTTFDGGGYGDSVGTSLAAPFASGAAALLRGAHGTWTAAQVRAQLLHTAALIDAANPGYEGLLGRGRLDAGAALNTTPQVDLAVEAITVGGQEGGQPEPGTTVDVHITLRNDWKPVRALQGTLSSNDSYVTINQNSTTFAAIETGAAMQSNTPLRIKVANNAPYGHELGLQLALRENGTLVATVPVKIVVANQTIEVSGLINSDTTWAGDRVYRVVNNTVIAEGVTLTVEAGARVLVELDKVLRVQGELLVNGTDDAPVVFTSAKDTPAAGDWVGIDVGSTGRVELAGCEITHGQTGVNISNWSTEHTITGCTIHHNNTGVRGRATISDSRILWNDGYAVESAETVRDSEIAYNGYGISGAEYVLRNIIHHNQDVSYGGSYAGAGVADSGYVYSNTIVMNTVGIAGSSHPDIQHNNIDRNLSYNFQLQGNQNVTVPNNWWGTTNLATIDEAIYDFGEDSNLGVVDVQPILTGPSTAAPTYFYDVDVDPGTTVGLEEVTLDLKFSGPMDESVAPDVVLKMEDWIDKEDVPGWTSRFVQDIAMTLDGAIWLATEKGVVQYDGSEGTIHLPAHNIRSLAVDTNGHLWAGSYSYLWRFDGSEWKEYSQEAELSYNHIIADPNHGIWLPNCGFVTHFDGVTATEYHFADLIDDFYCIEHADVSPDGTLWLADYEKVISFGSNQWREYEHFGGIILAVAGVNENEVWLNNDTQLSHLDDGEWTVHRPTSQFEYYSSNIEIAANGDVLVAASNHVRVFRYDGSTWAVMDSLSDKLVGSIRHIHDTGRGSLLLGTNNGALHLYETSVASGHWLDENTFQATHHVTSLMPRGDYNVEASGAADAEGKETPPVSHFAFTLDYAGEVADATPPPAPSLLVNGVEGDASAVTASWLGHDPDSAILAYRYGIGTTAGGREIVDWTNTTETRVTRTGLGFVEGQTYWFSVQAQNSGGLWSETRTRSFVAGETSYDVLLPLLLRP